MNKETGKVFIVDDDEAIRDALSWLLKSRGLNVQSFQNAESFLQHVTAKSCGCVLLDIRMTGMSGLETYDELRRREFQLPVIFLTGHGDVPMAVGALKKGAYDFVEKPFNDNELVDRVISALEWDDKRVKDAVGKLDMEKRLSSLTSRERQVMELVLVGRLNKVIADELGITMRTVEVHRAHVFEKMGVKTAVELAQMLSAYKAATG